MLASWFVLKPSVVLLLCVISVYGATKNRGLFEEGESYVKTNYSTIFGKSAVRRQIELAGFGYENYTVVTEDGYKININRIVNTKKIGPDRGYPILLINGYFMQSEAWLVHPRADTNTPFVLAAKGYDVWLGDQRGTMRSKGHVKYTVKDDEYWDFSFHESGVYDMASFVDFILQKTGYKNLIFSCMSMGCSLHGVLASERPSYNEKIRAAIYFVPLVNNIRKITDMNAYMNLAFRALQFSTSFFERAGIKEVFLNQGKFRKEIYYLCRPFQYISYVASKILYGSTIHIPAENMCNAPNLSSGGTNVKSSVHVVQVYDTGDFAQYNYGREGNMKKYGREMPPLYDMSKITSFVAIYYSDRDDFSGPEGVEKTRKSLGGPTYLCEMPNLNHFDVAGGLTFRYVLPDAVELIDALSGMRNNTKKLQSGRCPSLEWIRHLKT